MAVKLSDVPSTANFPDNFDWRDEIFMSREDIDALPNIGVTDYAEDLNVGYRYFTSEGVPVSYPFGYGLSYTDFDYSDPVITRKGDNYKASIIVTNTGSHPGKEVVQLYVTAPDSNLKKPKLELKRIWQDSRAQTR